MRDGKPYPPKNLREMEILPGVKTALDNLQSAGYLLIVVTNQPDVARGTTKKESVDEINMALAKALPINEFRTCFHMDSDNCSCRKPRPGALLSAAKLHDINLTQSFMVGDRWRDIEAGQRAGCRTCFIDYGYREKQPQIADFYALSLLEASKIILGEL